MPASDTGLRRSLRRAERRRLLSGLGLTLPLVAFLLGFFLLPILGMLEKSVENPEIRAAMPETARALQDWNGEGIPDEAVLATFAREVVAAQKARTLASVAKRLNVEHSGWRSVVMAAGRGLPEAPEGSWRDTFAKLDPAWTEPEIWQAMKRAAAPYTDFYLLAALDLQRGDDGAIRSASADEAIYRTVLWRTLWISTVVTLACLFLGYPLAYRLATLPEGTANLLMILVLLPFWTSLLVRTASWIVLLQREGPINEILQRLGLITEPLALVFNRTGVYVAMTHVLLPFMVLPLYSVMRGIPPSFVRAALSLGARPTTAFFRVYLPLSMPGVAAGCLLVFILAIGYYITPALVGGQADQMISYFVAFFTLQTVNWGMAAALGSVLLAATIVLYLVYARLVGIDRLRLG
ncbi:ABC transporter permease [Benzoatithermus flavus]|uniref:ABC transporter permease n=1 Tax=Benzoatithermus flavus TaxID=3108223 RepID=A0ABU8XTT0_9PROT